MISALGFYEGLPAGNLALSDVLQAEELLLLTLSSFSPALISLSFCCRCFLWVF